MEDKVIVQKPSKGRMTSFSQDDCGKRLKKKFLQTPHFDFHCSGRKKKLAIPAIVDVILYIQTPASRKPDWVEIVNRKAIQKIAVVFVPGLFPEDLGLHDFQDEMSAVHINDECKLPFVKREFDTVLPFTAPYDKEKVLSSYATLTLTSYTKKEKAALLKLSQDTPLKIEDLLLSAKQFEFIGLPIHPLTPQAVQSQVEELPAGWIETKSSGNCESKIFSLDCEMCKAANGAVLTRLSVVDENKNVVMDEFVKPAEEIIDYRTQYSGISKETLEYVNKTLEDVQQQFLAIVSAEDILVGHSLENDFAVMKLRHPKVIDTTILYDAPSGPPHRPALKYLTKTFLFREIQQGILGHDSVEDSIACLDLLRLKLRNGRLFGMATPKASLFEKLRSHDGAPVVTTVVNYPGLVSAADMEFADTCIICDNDEEVTTNMLSQVESSDLLIASLRELEFVRGVSLTYSNFTDADRVSSEDAIVHLNNRLENIYDALPEHTAFIVCPGIGDNTRLRGLQKELNEFARNAPDYKEARTDWKSANKERFADAMSVAKDTFCMMKVKNISKDTTREQ